MYQQRSWPHAHAALVPRRQTRHLRPLRRLRRRRRARVLVVLQRAAHPRAVHETTLAGFTASSYDPGAWARLFARAGARYAVLTARHHDGVALWDTAQDGLSVARDTPALPRPDRRIRRRAAPAGPEGRSVLLPLGLVAPRLPHRPPSPPRPARGAGQRHPVQYPRARRRGPGRLAPLPGLPRRAGGRADHPLPAGPALVRRRVGALRGAVGDRRTRRPDPRRQPAHRAQRPHAQPRRLRHPRAGRTAPSPGRALGVVPNGQ